MAAQAAQIRIGVSGWRYPPWRGGFYPSGLTQAKELAFASRQFPAIELNGSFYSLQRPASYLHWAADTPDGFVFTVKGPRYVTHLLRLRNAEVAMANFFASGVLALGAKLGPFLWQLPPNLPYDEPVLDAFLARLPRDTDAALALARGRDPARMSGKEWLGPVEPLRLRHALEVRHPSFCQPQTVELLRRHGVALVVADAPRDWPEVGDVTADFVYLRLHGAQQLYASGYTDAQLATWAGRIRAWARGAAPTDMTRLSNAPAAPAPAAHNVFCFFDNTGENHAPRDALTLAGLLALDDQLQIPG